MTGSATPTMLPPLSEIPHGEIAVQPANPEASSGFSQFLTYETLTPSPPPAVIQARRKLFMRQVSEVDKMFNRFHASLESCVLSQTEEAPKIGQAIERAKTVVRRGLESQRKILAITVLFHRTRIQICKIRSLRLQRAMEKTAEFRAYLGTFLKNDDQTPPNVDVARFMRSLRSTDPKLTLLKRRRLYLRAHRKNLVPQRPGTGDWLFNILHPDTKSGKVIERFEDKIAILRYEEVFSILEHLCSENSLDFRRVEALLFDLAWSKRSYPFGFSGPGFGSRRELLPVKGDLFPAVIASTSLNPELAFTPFSVLNGLRWPFKTAVDMIFEMIILTNPFDIARVYWDIIQEVTRSMQRLLVIGGTNPEDIEIDFDSLFPVLMICVFVFGVDEWMRVALYTVSFGEHVGDDPQLQFAMSYLEALLTQIIALDRKALKQKAAEMRRAWADEQTDPLGLQ
jgi:hypothetical protein